jgi:hypothetical protein
MQIPNDVLSIIPVVGAFALIAVIMTEIIPILEQTQKGPA